MVADVDPTAPGYGEFPLREFLGMELDAPEPGRSIATAPVTDRLLNPNGVVHGAALFALVDTSMGGATMSLLDPSECFCASIEVALRFLRPATGGTVRVETSVLRQGRRVVHLESRVSTDVDGLVATAAGSFSIIPLR